MRTKAEANRFYAVMTACTIAGLLALSVTVWMFRPADLDAATLCPTSRPIAGHTVVIVDRTDRWSPGMGAALRELIEAAQRETRQYQKFSIVSLDAEQSTHPLFSVCNPGAPTFWSDLYHGRRYTQQDFEQKFVGAADQVVEAMGQPAEAPASPIIEYVHRWLGSDDFNASTPQRRLVLISDMRQNSPLYSIYRSPPAQLAPVAVQQFGQGARAVAFDVYFLAHGRDHNVSETEVHTAWDRAFHQAGARYTWRQID
jgi:hypothetical protein